MASRAFGRPAILMMLTSATGRILQGKRDVFDLKPVGQGA